MLPSIEADYPGTWKRRRFKRRLVLRLLLLAVALFVAGVIGALRHAPWTPLALGFIFPLLLGANLLWIWSLYFRCPRCGNLFGSTSGVRSTGGGKPRRNPLTRECLTCGLPLRDRNRNDA